MGANRRRHVAYQPRRDPRAAHQHHEHRAPPPPRRAPTARAEDDHATTQRRRRASAPARFGAGPRVTCRRKLGRRVVLRHSRGHEMVGGRRRRSHPSAIRRCQVPMAHHSRNAVETSMSRTGDPETGGITCQTPAGRDQSRDQRGLPATCSTKAFIAKQWLSFGDTTGRTRGA